MGMTHDKAVYTVDFEQSQYNAVNYNDVADMVVIDTDGETITSNAVNDNKLEVIITGNSHVIPMIESELKKALPHNTIISCKVE